MRRGRAYSREQRHKAICHAKKLEKDLGTKGGSLYERHLEKIEKSAGYYSKGNISHYINTNPQIREKSNDYGSRKSYPNQKKDDSYKEQMNEYMKNQDN